MPASPFDSQIYGDLFGDQEIARLFSDSAEIRAMLIAEGALAKAQGELGMIPAEAASAIHRASLEALIDPSSLAAATAGNAVPVPALVTAFRAQIPTPDAAGFAHWGATSQDIVDTGLALRLRQVLALYETRLSSLSAAMADLAERHATTPMAGRTWGMVATPSSFGALVASWGKPLLRAADRLEQQKPTLLSVSLSGAAGTLSAMGADGSEVRAHLARALNLSDPGGSTHSTRDSLADFAGWMTTLTGSLGKMGEDVLSLTRSGEARLSMGGGSSTMPQKQNPVLPSLMVALSRHMVGLNGSMQTALAHRDQRDGSAWMLEWLSLPQMCQATGRVLVLAEQVARALHPDADTMLGNIDDGLGLTYAEALSFRLARQMPRPQAQSEVKSLCLQARDDNTPLPALAAARWPEVDFGDLFTPEAQMGDAPSETDGFVAAVRQRG